MTWPLTPSSVGQPSANYALAVVSDAPSRMLHTSGIGPVKPDGSVPDGSGSGGVQRQADVVWRTILTLLSEASMAPSDIVSVSTYVVTTEGGDLSTDLAGAMAARDAALGEHRCASTLVPVPALATPSWRLEIAIVAVSGS